MKSTGIVRNLDSLGRIVIPMELRKILGMGEREPIEIFVDDDRVILRKHYQGCALCYSTEKLHILERGKPVCDECITNLYRMQLSHQGSTKGRKTERD